MLDPTPMRELLYTTTPELSSSIARSDLFDTLKARNVTRDRLPPTSALWQGQGAFPHPLFPA